MPRTSTATAPPITTAPTQSSGFGSSSFDDAMVSDSTNSATAAAVNAQKIDCHDHRCSRPPDPSIPTTAPLPAAPAQIPTALLRWSFGYAAVINDSVAGMTNAAPAPAAPRAMMRCRGSDQRAGATDATPKIARPTSMAPRRPYRSPSAPAGSSRQASTSV